ncbi:major facilitator superfamily domain-containing protein [Syncephalastrum racemosum]|uniref:Major facilitator superfamily domain-containing protein n=1 Tax=Syncephalastrum racemosum TaxID=13706 RepID=A0A1X2HKD3_SYNRA|nr:major facilitator superfamily domain-containing protein [Syncephalastrum racemosum]
METDPPPFPTRQLFLVCAVRIAEPISFAVKTPFIYFMVRDFLLGSEAEIGTYVGFLTAAFSTAQLISAMPMGMLSDRIGRRPVVLLGLAATIIGMVLFGVSKNYTWALVVKILTGLLDGNIAVLKSMITELTSRNTEAQRTQAFSLLQVTFAAGTIIGSMLGGYLCQPVDKYPSVFGRGGWLTDFFALYPYSLPCFVAGFVASLGWIAGYFLLEETLAMNAPILLMNEEEEGLLSNTRPHTYTQTQEAAPSKNFLKSIIGVLTPTIVLLCAIYGAAAYQDLFYDELLPLWSATEFEKGGLGLTTGQIGIALSFGGAAILAVQMTLHYLTRLFSVIGLFRFSLLMSVFVFAFQGCARYLPDTLMYVGFLAGISMKSFCQAVGFTMSIVLLNDITAHSGALGTVNAIAQCCSAAMRALAPATTGVIWSTTIGAISIPFSIRIHLVWIILALVAVITYALCLCVRLQ